MLVTVILGHHILETKPSILRQNTVRKSKQIMAADDNISHSDSHSKIEVMRLQQLPHLIMSRLYLADNTALNFFCGVTQLVSPELTLS